MTRTCSAREPPLCAGIRCSATSNQDAQIRSIRLSERRAPLAVAARVGFIGGRDPVLPVPSGSPLGDALAAGRRRDHRHGFTRTDLWPLIGRFCVARGLAPAPG